MAIIGTTIKTIRPISPLRNATAIARAMTESKTILAALGTMPGLSYGNMNNLNSIDWLIEKCAYSDLRPELWEVIKEQARQMYQNEIESLIIKKCAEESTSEAHKKEIHRQQIIETYIAAKMERNLVKKHFAYKLKLERVTAQADKYYNETYNI